MLLRHVPSVPFQFRWTIVQFVLTQADGCLITNCCTCFYMVHHVEV